ncbi:MAG: 30S ribosomal protein S6 [Candidatus Omnitrophica bacterium]|nr:30S ribosomal protein S6 [Candidatus Omnitrophota bacterium]MDD5592961.1 30S ribosomal protein S6 [Candidatus Omnitrophota bacterium]
MKKYEIMFIIKPDLSEEEKKTLFDQIGDVVAKNNGKVSSAAIWSEKRKLYFTIKKHREGVYYLVNFTVAPGAIVNINHAYALNENILRVLVTALE